MSNLHIALVAEGKTDFEVIKASLDAIFAHKEYQFVLTQIQPEPTNVHLGEGWCGVIKWCEQMSKRHQGGLKDDPTLSLFDLIIMHLDLDVLGFNYEHCGSTLSAISLAHAWNQLPVQTSCPPITNDVISLKSVISSWLGNRIALDAKTILCFPAQSSGTWLAAATLPAGHGLLNNIECNANVENQLGRLPLKQRIRKSSREYRKYSSVLITNWSVVKALCSQANQFEQDVHGWLRGEIECL